MSVWAAWREEAVHRQHSPAHPLMLSAITRKVSISSPKMTVTVLNANRGKVMTIFAVLDFRRKDLDTICL